MDLTTTSSTKPIRTSTGGPAPVPHFLPEAAAEPVPPDAHEYVPDPATYPWDMMPADPRDRAAVLVLASVHGIRPRWAGRAADPDPVARLHRLERRLVRLRRAVRREAEAAGLLVGQALDRLDALERGGGRNG